MARSPTPPAAPPRLVAATVSFLAVLAWMALPPLHALGLGHVCAGHHHGPAEPHAHGAGGHECAGHHATHEHEEEAPEPCDDHDPGTCALCGLASLSPTPGVAPPPPLPAPARVHHRPAPQPRTAPPAVPSLTDAPPRGPPALRAA